MVSELIFTNTKAKDSSLKVLMTVTYGHHSLDWGLTNLLRSFLNLKFR